MKTKSWLHWKTSVVTSFCKLKVNSCQFHNLLPNTGGNLMFWKWCHLTEGLFFFLPQFSKTQNSLTVVSQWTCLCSYFFPLDNVKSKWWGVNFHSHNSPQKLRFVDNVNLLYFYIKRVLALMSLILAITDNLTKPCRLSQALLQIQSLGITFQSVLDSCLLLFLFLRRWASEEHGPSGPWSPSDLWWTVLTKLFLVNMCWHLLLWFCLASCWQAMLFMSSLPWP